MTCNFCKSNGQIVITEYKQIIRDAHFGIEQSKFGKKQKIEIYADCPKCNGSGNEIKM